MYRYVQVMHRIEKNCPDLIEKYVYEVSDFDTHTIMQLPFYNESYDAFRFFEFDEPIDIKEGDIISWDFSKQVVYGKKLPIPVALKFIGSNPRYMGLSNHLKQLILNEKNKFVLFHNGSYFDTSSINNEKTVSIEEFEGKENPIFVSQLAQVMERSLKVVPYYERNELLFSMFHQFFEMAYYQYAQGKDPNFIFRVYSFNFYVFTDTVSSDLIEFFQIFTYVFALNETEIEFFELYIKYLRKIDPFLVSKKEESRIQ